MGLWRIGAFSFQADVFCYCYWAILVGIVYVCSVYAVGTTCNTDRKVESTEVVGLYGICVLLGNKCSLSLFLAIFCYLLGNLGLPFWIDIIFWSKNLLLE